VASKATARYLVYNSSNFEEALGNGWWKIASLGLLVSKAYITCSSKWKAAKNCVTQIFCRICCFIVSKSGFKLVAILLTMWLPGQKPFGLVIPSFSVYGGIPTWRIGSFDSP
jgi:hypothetical protein